MFEFNQAIKLVIDPETGLIIDANQAACNFYGYTKAELTRLTIFDINTLSPDEARAEMRRAQAMDKLYFNFRHRLADGQVRDVEVYTGPRRHGRPDPALLHRSRYHRPQTGRGRP